MENKTDLGTSFVFLGLLEMERFRYVCFVLAFSLYVITMTLCCVIVYVIWVEESLHEPMYIFIWNLMFNGVFGNTVVSPQYIISLLIASSKISFYRCLTQIFCVQLSGGVEVFTFTAMAYDRYLAVGHPLRYPVLMTNMSAVKYITGSWVSALIIVTVAVIMTAKLKFCGVNINNIYCDNMFLVTLACGDSAMVNNLFGIVVTLLFMFGTFLIIVYCYIKTLLICLKISRAACLKAMHTLGSHIITFSVHMVAAFFVFLRYRLNGLNPTVTTHVLLSIMGLLTSVIVNPIVYGIKTESLKAKIIQNIQKLNFWKSV